MPKIFGFNMFDPDCEICGQEMSFHGAERTDCEGRFSLTIKEINSILKVYMVFEKLLQEDVIK